MSFQATLKSSIFDFTNLLTHLSLLKKLFSSSLNHTCNFKSQICKKYYFLSLRISSAFSKTC